MGDKWLPAERHAKELLDHSHELIKEDSERGLKIALILTDNAIEIMIRGYLRYYKELSPRNVEDLKFHELLKEASSLNTLITDKKFIMAFHDLRNELYHTGSLNPSKKDVIFGLNIAERIFNELHPEHKVSVNHVTLPNSQTILMLSNIRYSSYMMEIYYLTVFGEMFKKKGYDFYAYPKMDRIVLDAIATKDKEIVILEIKSNAERMRPDSLRHISENIQMMKTKNMSKEIRFWLISKGVFKREYRNNAETLGIILIDDTNIRDYVAVK